MAICACGGKTRVLESRRDEHGNMRRRRLCLACGDDWQTVEVRAADTDASVWSHAYFTKKINGCCPRCGVQLGPDLETVLCEKCAESARERARRTMRNRRKPTEPNDGGAGDTPCTTTETTGLAPKTS